MHITLPDSCPVLSCLRVRHSPVRLSQRVVSFSILCDLYRNDANGTNPFLPFFLEAIEKGTDPVEKQYLIHLLCSPPTNRNVSVEYLLLGFCVSFPQVVVRSLLG